MPRAIVIRAAGTNCDQEMLRAFTDAGADADLVHLDALCRAPATLDAYDMLGFPGGFSFGDDIASGRIFAMKLREKLYPALREAVQRGCPMIGACNGFQTLVQVGLLPGPSHSEWPATPPQQTVALSDNQDAKFWDRWVGLSLETSSVCIWTRALANAYPQDLAHHALQLPAAHGEGRFVAADDATLRTLEQRGQVALRYTDNYNGSQGAIAGISDASGLILGLMPHPERFLDWNRHPYWTRLDPRLTSLPTPGQIMFRSAVETAATVRT